VANNAYRVTWLVRRLFRALADTADSYLEDAGLTAADRAVMEFLENDGALTVPDIARRYRVSRQHIQVTVNGLLERGLVVAGENPNHKRSPLLSLTATGRATYADIRAGESRLLDSLFADIEIADVETTGRTLSALLSNLAKENSHASKN